MSHIIQLWIAVLTFFLIHQTEEIFYSIGEWHKNHKEPSWTSFISKSLMVKMETRFKRALLVLLQCILLLIVAFFTHTSLLATQITITIFICIMLIAFIMHITLSIVTRSSMPGLSTSVFPGCPVGLFLLYLTWNIK
jgi:hypothetical protein